MGSTTISRVVYWLQISQRGSSDDLHFPCAPVDGLGIITAQVAFKHQIQREWSSRIPNYRKHSMLCRRNKELTIATIFSGDVRLSTFSLRISLCTCGHLKLTQYNVKWQANATNITRTDTRQSNDHHLVVSSASQIGNFRQTPVSYNLTQAFTEDSHNARIKHW